MPREIQRIRNLTLQHFHEMEALELQFYDAEFITPAVESWRWYKLYPHSTVAAEVDGKLAGFVNLFPVQPEVYRELRAGRFNDHFMELEHVAPLSQQPLHMFLSCILVGRQFRKMGLTRQLLQAAVQPYAALPCVGVVTDNVTEDGCRFSERYGFTHLCHSEHGSEVYEQSWPDFVSHIAFPPPSAQRADFVTATP